MSAEPVHTQLNRTLGHQDLVLDVTRRIADSTTLDETMACILDSVLRAFKPDGVRLLVAPGSRAQVFTAGPLADAMSEGDSRIVGLVAERGEIELSSAADLPAGLGTLVAVPLTARAVLQGVLWLGTTAPGTFDPADRSLLAILSAQAAIAIAHARALAASRKGREWLAAVLASTPDPVLVVDTALHLQLVNPAAQAMLSDIPEGAIGQPLGHIDALAELASVFSPRDEFEPPVREYTTAEGRCYQPTLSEVYAEHGEMVGWVLVLRDITHFKRVNDNMAQFLSSVSHDMRSPLTFMKGYLDMLGMVGNLNERQADFVEKIVGGVVQMSDLVEKVLDAGRLDPLTGTYELRREPCDVVEILQKVVTNLAEPAAKKGLELRHAAADGIPVLALDRGMVTSAFTNLVENAVKYTPEGGQISVELQIEGDSLVFRVVDNGYGISPEDQKRLFARNVRIHRKEWKRVKGSGLGLFIVKNVAQRHGGDAWVESIEGKGSEFTVSIPLAIENLIGSKSTTSE